MSGGRNWGGGVTLRCHVRGPCVCLVATPTSLPAPTAKYPLFSLQRDSGPHRIPMAILTCETRCLWAPRKGLSLPFHLAHCNKETLPIERLWGEGQGIATGDLFSHVENKNSIESWSFPRGVIRVEGEVIKATGPGAGQPRFKSNMLTLTSLTGGPLSYLAPAVDCRVLLLAIRCAPPGPGGRGAPGVLVQGPPPLTSPGLLPVSAHDTHFTGEQNEARKGD